MSRVDVLLLDLTDRVAIRKLDNVPVNLELQVKNLLSCFLR